MPAGYTTATVPTRKSWQNQLFGAGTYPVPTEAKDYLEGTVLNPPALNATNDAARKAYLASLPPGTTFTGLITAADVGLGNVNNTSDANKPISTATQTALDAKPDNAAEIGLGNVNNTSDLAKPISTATQAALNLKADA